MQTRLSNNLTKFNIIRKEQFGFRTKLSAEYTRYTLTNKILNAFNNKLMARGIFWLRVGSHSVNYDILLSKLLYYGIKGTEKAL
jgi:hypothetical protein